MSENQVPAGWYPDPMGDTSKIRYWNGSAWTEDYMDAAVSAAQAVMPGADGADGLASVSASSPYEMPAATTAQTNGWQGASSVPGQQPYGYQPGFPAMGMPGELPGKDRKGFAIAGLVLGIISVLGCIFNWLDVLPGILALIFGILGLKSSKKSLAIVGIVLGAIGLVLAVLMLVLALDVIANPAKYGLPPNYFNNLLTSNFLYLR